MQVLSASKMFRRNTSSHHDLWLSLPDLLSSPAVFPPRSPLLTGKGNTLLPSLSLIGRPLLLSSLSLIGRPLLRQGPPLTPQPTLIGRLTPLLVSYQSLPPLHLLHPHNHLLNFHYFFPLPPALTHLPLHYQTPSTFCLPLPPPYGNFQPSPSSFLYLSDPTHLRCHFIV